MSDRSYHVVACSLPIVYTLEGDYDPNGMIFVPKQVVPLLHWFKELWDRDTDASPGRGRRKTRITGKEILPGLHHRRQRAQLVIDGLARLDLMVARLSEGPDGDRRLLERLIAEETHPSSSDCNFYGSGIHHHYHHHHGHQHRHRESDRMRAVRTNIERQISDLQIALTDLGDVKGLRKWRSVSDEPDPVEAEGVQSANARIGDPFEERPIRLVSLTSRQRMEWRAFWKVQARLIDEGIETWFESLEGGGRLEGELKRLARGTGIPLPWIKRLLLNDHKHPDNRAQPYDRFNPLKPIPLVRPLVLRACVGETIDIALENSLDRRPIGFFVQGHTKSTDEGAGPYYADGSHLGGNLDSRCKAGERQHFSIRVEQEGVWPINDLADVRGNEAGTNTHGLFGALIVEPEGTHWRDPETGEDLTGKPWVNALDVDLLPSQPTPDPPAYVDYATDRKGRVHRAFREFTVFIHDEPETHSGLHTVGEHSIMPLSYRAEPMHNRYPHRIRKLADHSEAFPRPIPPGSIDLRAFRWDLSDELDEFFHTALTSDGEWLEQVAGEEQHHSSWLFGEPVTHVQRAYAGDPCRVRLVHAGVKETHVYHLHVHEWRAVATDVANPSVHGGEAYGERGIPNKKGSHLLDSITISPQTGMTIDPLFGSGSRQHAVGDIIWHCHLYPHFHHGMWGLWRSHDRRVDGSRAYPDGTRCPPLQPLPDREPPPATAQKPGFPWFIDGTYPAKSPPPPAARHEHRNGRRILLKMPDASPRERDAMAPGCSDGSQPGALFVDLDGLAAKANLAAGLPPPRKVSYDIEVRSDPIEYNVDGWHDPRGHRYRLMGVKIFEKKQAAGDYVLVHQETFEERHDNPEPCFPRANHGDIVEWRQHNNLGSFTADQYDFGQLPVECGLHVHLVKFDVLAADGSATGWNYLSGASCREAVGADGAGEQRTVSLHRWIVDEEFGPCFFHDHLLANFRQKRGLFSALMTQPHGSQWHRHDDHGRTAWDSQQAVIVPPKTSCLPPYREACLAVADFVPLQDRRKRALNPPSVLSGVSDPGAMGVNYRAAPMHFRGADPSSWFSSAVRGTPNFGGDRGDPDTPIILSYPGERIRIRLIQGSHEEQHSFTAHGLRWRHDWGHPKATLVNQQTLGISEAFTLDINPADASPYGVGDHLWHFGTIDDIWLGTWGLVRVMPPIAQNFERLSPLPDLLLSPEAARGQLAEATAGMPPSRNPQAKVHTYVVVAQRKEHRFTGDVLTDPWGLIYRVLPYSNKEFETALTKAKARDSNTSEERYEGWPIEPADRARLKEAPDAPLVLRARRGGWIRLILVNDLLSRDSDDLDDKKNGRVRFGPEPSPARVPVEHRDENGWPDRRTISPRASIHPSLLLYDVRSHDGSFVGLNPDTTVSARRQRGDEHGLHDGDFAEAPGGRVISRSDHGGFRNWREYWWYADEALAPATHEHGMGQVCYLHDMADIRNHRHHGLIGALIVLPGDVKPYAPGSQSAEADGWTSLSADIRGPDGALVARETCWFMQDGLRFFVHGNPNSPVPDAEHLVDPVDAGQKGVNYRSYPVHRGEVARTDAQLAPEPILLTRPGDQVWLRVVGANDKPRQHSIVVHGAALQQAAWMGSDSPLVGALSGIAPCRVSNVSFKLLHPGDHAVRTGCFLWGTEQGMWAQIRSAR